jgi:hypothetical protein
MLQIISFLSLFYTHLTYKNNLLLTLKIEHQARVNINFTHRGHLRL